jgi:DNA polymerase I-like protein with 3'-5' exonuclease and polymerase domains
MPSWLALLFCDEVFYWDGCFTRRNHYSSNSKNNADWVQAMFALTGTRANVRPYAGTKNTNWQVDVTRRDYSMTTNVERKSVPYTGKVYCVSVPSSYIIVRRNGKVSVTGNCQNWPKHLRKLIIPAPGNVIVGADADQLELRIITAIAQIQIYLEAFADKKDPHAMTASLMFGRAFDQLEPKSDQWSKLRTIAKGIKYASFYGSGDETVHGLVTSAEDENGNLMYPDLSVREVATLKRNWLKGIPELPKWWDATVESFRKDGYIRDPVWGRQRDFLDGEAFNEIVNHPIQSAGAHIIHESTFDLLQDIPFNKWGPNTGLISQVHDALYVECPESEAAWVEGMLKKHMNRAVYGLDGVEFAAKPKTGKTWADV